MKVLSAIKSIRKHCIECSAGNRLEVKLCVIPHCPLFPYRMGRNPNIKKGVRGKVAGNGEALRKWHLQQGKKANKVKITGE